ncbi:hypothetical protein ARALYDRAFT_486184 [Arabidopsis lyrata subsp. lyrata]|uniref:DUF7780 domain-containing protein n=1 Tax=Arabidopsis lyrata subsp. lyrata TaxID=81972 RepID=D7LVS1_ARALL|nr:uncharacterized protein LOC9312484 [Arabidopsis lyrata subsp. lyrata]EFH52675.1 hypothetical protein ARALYDRAFT_486184 [Arabidopsis lyrata subsp. lyrata]|eukprot:XP_020881414.1 uncharacterized protein LOC9312484 [Arabidopsis lyrata subsp. lyrata]
MGLISAKETKNNNSRGMGLLLVFFPDHHNDDSPSSSSSSPSPATTLFRSRSSRLLLSKAQSTISICILLLFLTLFLFTLSTFEPSSGFPAVSSRPHRRFLLNRDISGSESRRRYNRFALQGMGTLFLRGTKSMHDLIVAHVASDTTEDDLRLFMRLLHRSGVTSKSDVVLLFNSGSRFVELIEEENDSFLKLVDVHRNSNSSNQIDSVWGFNLANFMKKQSSKKETSSSSSEPIWGKKTHRANNFNDSSSLNNSTESTELLTHGSVVGFDVTELDPENSLSGFMDHVPISLRRWACYPMLLGRVRRNFKHVMLVDAKTSLFLGDPLTRIRNRSPESVLFFSKHSSSKKSSEVNPAILIGGAKGIRRLASSMHTEIVRATIQQQHKKKNSVTESVVLSQLVGNVHMTKNFEVVTSESVVPEASSLAELRTRNSAASSIKNHDIIQRGGGNSNHIIDIIMKRICSCELDSSVYNYC